MPLHDHHDGATGDDGTHHKDQQGLLKFTQNTTQVLLRTLQVGQAGDGAVAEAHPRDPPDAAT